jgi:hypothetical protein
MRKGRLSLAVLIPCIALVLAAPAAAFGQAWTPTGGGDHAGADWIPADGALIAGVHTNINIFRVAPGSSVYVASWDGAQFGSLDIQAETITIEGVLSASGRGHGGGAGGSNDSCCNDNQNGATAGANGSGGSGGNAHWSCGGT